MLRNRESKRTTCYDILMELEKEGLISETAKGSKRLFVGEDPENIQKRLREKETLFSEILPQLKSVYNIKGTKPKIRFYEGKEGLKSIYTDTLKYKGEIVAFISDEIVRVLGNEWAENYIKERYSKKIKLRAIYPATKWMKEKMVPKDQEHLRASKLISLEKYPFSVDINIYGHQKVALLSAREETAVLIEGAEIYNTMKLIFELLWDNLPEVKVK